MSDVLIYALLAVGIAVALDLWLMRRAQRYWAERSIATEPGQQARLFGRFSPVLTWLKYDRLPGAPEATLSTASQPADNPPDATPEQSEREPSVLAESQAEPANLALIPSPAPSTPSTWTVSVGSSAIEIDLRVRVRLPHSLHLPTWLGGPIPQSVPGTPSPGSAWAARDLERAELILGAIGLAAAAQILVRYGQFRWGIGVYVAAAAVLAIWALSRPASRERLIQIATLSRRAEVWLVILLIGLAAFGRYYRLDQRIYGVDGDEKNWTLQSYFSVIQGERRGDFADRHFHYQPITFYLQGWAMQLLGINLLTPRYLNATMSLMALALFYLLMRRAVGPPTALLGTCLAAFSFIELSASRQAVHDTLIEFWVLLVFFLLIEAIHRRDERWFLAAGSATAFGMLTYETFYLTPVVALIYLIVCALRERKNWIEWATFVVVFLLPMILVVPSTLEYIRARQVYHLGSLRQGADLWPYVANRVVESLSTLFYAIKYPDQLVRWGGGPIVNIWLLPFFVIGLAYALVTRRNSHVIFLAVWFVLEFFPFAVLGAPFPRVYYPAMMAAPGLAAVGLVASLKAIRQLFPNLGSRALLIGLAVVLIGIVMYDVNVFAVQIVDPDDQQKRRELADLIRASASNAPMTYLPYIPLAGDVIEVEQNLAEFSAAGARGVQRPTDYYALVELDHLMGHIWDERMRYSTVNIIFDKTAYNDPNRAQRTPVLNTLRWCYPRTSIQTERYFDVYHVPAEDLQEPVCHSTNTLTLLQPEIGSILAAGQPASFEWRIDASPQTVRLVVEHRNPRLIWLEAESYFDQNQGWFGEAKFAADYSGAGYLADNWRAGAAVAQVNVTQAGKYRLWVRTYRRAMDDQRTFVALNGEPPVEIAAAQQTLNTWVWQTAGDYSLNAGQHKVILSRTYGADPHRSIFVDAVVLSADPAFDPKVHTAWMVALDTGQLPRATSFQLEQGLPPGQYRWRVEIYDGDRLVNGLGQQGIGSPAREFNVAPEKSPSG